MLTNKWTIFGLGVAAGAITVSVMRTPVFRKVCSKLIGKGMQLKEEAAAFAETIKEEVQDIAAEAKYNNSESAKNF